MENKFIRLLVSYRITISFLILVAMISSGFLIAMISGVTSGKFAISQNIGQYIPTAMLLGTLFLLVFYTTTTILKSKFERDSIDIGKDESETIKNYDEAFSFGSKKIRTAFACFGSFIAVLILVSILSIILGQEEHLGGIFITLIYVGIPVWFLLTWRFFKRKLT